MFLTAKNMSRRAAILACATLFALFASSFLASAQTTYTGSSNNSASSATIGGSASGGGIGPITTEPVSPPTDVNLPGISAVPEAPTWFIGALVGVAILLFRRRRIAFASNAGEADAIDPSNDAPTSRGFANSDRIISGRAIGFFAIVCILLASAILAFGQTERFWSGGDGTGSQNIDVSSNWYSPGPPVSGDNLTFNNTSGWHRAYDNYGAGSYFGNLITYGSAGAIEWAGDKTYLYKFENNSSSGLLWASATLSNRTGSPDSDLEINPVGSGGVKVTNVDIQNGKSILVYGTNQLEVAGTISQSGTGNASFTVNGAATVLFESANTYAGATTLNAGKINASATNSLGSTGTINVNSSGTLLLTGSGVTDRIKDTAPINLAGGGTLAIASGLSEGTRPTSAVATDGAAGMGALTLAGTSNSAYATFDFGAGTGSTLAFSSLSGASAAFVKVLAWTGTPFADAGTSTNDRLLFASDPGLSSAQLSNWQFYNDSGALIGQGAMEINYGNMFEIVAVPEPGTWAIGVLTLAAILATQRKRFSQIYRKLSI